MEFENKTNNEIDPHDIPFKRPYQARILPEEYQKLNASQLEDGHWICNRCNKRFELYPDYCESQAAIEFIGLIRFCSEKCGVVYRPNHWRIYTNQSGQMGEGSYIDDEVSNATHLLKDDTEINYNPN